MESGIIERLCKDQASSQSDRQSSGSAEFSATVSNAGGVGMISSEAQETPADLAKEIARCRAITKQPIGVSVDFNSRSHLTDYSVFLPPIIFGGVKLVEVEGRMPGDVFRLLNEFGVRVIQK
jgi:NAD(P)H-dependent flavin oxidoreductase YrpB (nitropropane dioxygenase family)